MFVLVCYDISEDKRRTKIHNILKSYGEWKQYSVFHCEVTDTQYARMRQRLSRVIKSEEDSILFHYLCACCQGKIERIGGRAPLDTTIFMV